MPNTVATNEHDPDITTSNELWDRATQVIPTGTQLLAKGPSQNVDGVAPKFLVRGKGTRVWDADDNEFIDFTMGVGPLSLGYRYPAVDDAIRAQLDDGIIFSLPHPLEVEVSELVADVIPCAESVRFTKTGAEATSAAVRVARAYTGREKIISCGYHGWHDWYIGVLPRKAGVPQGVQDLINTFAYNDADALAAALDDDVAAVIMEPMAFDWPQDGFLERVQELAHANGSLLIFDEIWTGFRWSIGGAQQYFGVTPDLATFSKSCANGMPIGLLTGRREVMEVLEEDVFFFTTFGGEALTLAATKATIEIIRDENVPAHMHRLGQKIADGVAAIAGRTGLADIAGVKGHPARTLSVFDPAGGDPLLQKSLVQQALIRRGILWGGFHNLSYSHSDEDVDYLLDAYEVAFAELAEAVAEGNIASRLRGKPVQPIFRRTGDFDTKPKER